MTNGPGVIFPRLFEVRLNRNSGLQTGDNGDSLDNERPWESRSFTLRVGVNRFSGPEFILPIPAIPGSHCVFQIQMP